MYDNLLIPDIVAAGEEATELRHHLHAHPETAFEEHATSDLVAGRLQEYGFSVHRGLGGTGVVGTLRKGKGTRRLGLRCEMDALPITEATDLPYASTHAGRMHACGHDGHTATLLLAARHLAGMDFNGTLNLIFQPAEEGLGGGRRMIEEGLFERFPCDAVFAYHNWPGIPFGRFATLPGRFMSSSDTVVVKVLGHGGHGSMPHVCIDAAVVAAHIVVALQTVVSRNVDPREMAVVSVGVLQAGSIPNAIAETARLELTVRAYSPEVRDLLRKRITELVTRQAQTFGAQVEIDYRWRYPALHNDPVMTQFVADTVSDWLGADARVPDMQPLTGSEDFAFMLEKVPGCYICIGSGDAPDTVQVHNAHFDFNDALLPLAASFWARLTRRFLV